MKVGKALLGVLAGIAGGAILGMLFAPEKGSDTRKKISKKGEDLADALNEKIDVKFHELLKAISGKLGKPERNMKNENDFIKVGKIGKEEIAEA
jgi:gas vesicle protein